MKPASVRIRIAQLNPTVGALEENTERAMAEIRSTQGSDVDLLLFPEMFIPGYPAQDLLLDRVFVEQNMRCVETLASQSGATTVLIGAVHLWEGDTYNGVAVLQEGKVQGWIHKSLLPTYDVFDEWRYFKPGRDNHPFPVRLRNGGQISLGIHICEDLWDEEIDYRICDLLAEAGVDLFVNLSASPFQSGKFQERSALIRRKVSTHQTPYVYVNQVGGQDQLVFDGQSLVMDKSGGWIHIGPQFKEDVRDLSVPLRQSFSGVRAEFDTSPEEELRGALVLGIRDYFRKTGHRGAVLGLSGGIDSALTACLAVDALGAGNVTGVAMPSRYSSDHSVHDAEALAKNLGIRYERIPIQGVVERFQEVYVESLGSAVSGLPEENLQARIRGNILMTLSNRDGTLLLTTGNKTEIALGYTTLYGDLSGGLAVISDLGKRTVYELSRYYNLHAGRPLIPESTLEKPPSAELREGQIDPFDYEIVAPLVNAIIEERLSREELLERGYNESMVDELLDKIRINEYKRQQMPPGIRVTPKAFGIGRRMPIVNHFRYPK